MNTRKLNDFSIVEFGGLRLEVAGTCGGWMMYAPVPLHEDETIEVLVCELSRRRREQATIVGDTRNPEDAAAMLAHNAAFRQARLDAFRQECKAYRDNCTHKLCIVA